MIRQENPNFVASIYAPNPKEVTYWIDLTASSDGQVIKCFINNEWLPVNDNLNNEQNSKITELQNRCAALESTKANKSTTLQGYGITDAYTKQETIDLINSKIAELTNNS